ncbi:MAG: transporter substrate-binding domain-containing protein [Anaerolinea sp.]|nr:transporter substrate-binding domain-containing protein [Anaerolinea sp.]
MVARAALIRRLSIAGLVLVLIAMHFSLTRSTGDIRQLLPTSHLRIGVDASYPPFASLRDGQYEGIDIALGAALAHALGVDSRFENISLDGLYDALSTQRVDVLISALVERRDRRSQVEYSLPYFNAGLVLVEMATERPALNMWQMAGRRIAFAFGSDAHFELNRWQRRVGPFMRLPYELPGYALDALRLGQADAALVSRTDLLTYLCHYPEWAVKTTEVTVVPYVIAAARENSALIDRIDEILRRWQADGTLADLIDAQFRHSC